MNISTTNSLRYPSELSGDSNWSLAPKSDWQRDVKGHLERQLSKTGWLNRLPCLLFFRKNMVQVTFDNWTLHFQASIGGDEFNVNETKYGDLEEKAIISFDVESGGRKIDVTMLRCEIHEALILAGIYDCLGVENHVIRGHVVWEIIDMHDTEFTATRIIDYMDAIYDIAEPILKRLQNE